ncbi:hypothetical protein HFQ13_10610 [Acidithiobacillus sp. VAN18-1]|uniref:Uncharacterized protein n=1 Tax=Igneacidithiobacillus copahuensis TaxID=2724909 RepID=A0AAE2YQS2_9PROT|nr:hypothetical protein [Igneacidithiobacillus copahuensis]MBU2788642.1 hypothetical protein [Igneacidithiobacillus copahuensis]MBU2796674.1 hypothetical protein [Acidithiobacillus sp. VAN18-2]
MSVMHYRKVKGNDVLNDAFMAVHWRLLDQYPHLEQVELVEDGKIYEMHDVCNPESLIGLTALGMALKIMHTINPRKVPFRRWIRAGNEPETLEINIEAPLSWLIPPLYVAMLMSAPVELWDTTKRNLKAEEQSWNVVKENVDKIFIAI